MSRLKHDKGSDASNKYDEEPEEEEVEFSDDEKEREHKQSLKQKKRFFDLSFAFEWFWSLGVLKAISTQTGRMRITKEGRSPSRRTGGRRSQITHPIRSSTHWARFLLNTNNTNTNISSHSSFLSHCTPCPFPSPQTPF